MLACLGHFEREGKFVFSGAKTRMGASERWLPRTFALAHYKFPVPLLLLGAFSRSLGARSNIVQFGFSALGLVRARNGKFGQNSPAN